MRKRNGPFRTSLVAMALLALGLVAGNAEAAFINGSVSGTGFFDALSASSNAIVSDLTTADILATAIFGSGTGAFAGVTPAGTANDISIVPFAPGVGYTITVGLTTFNFTDLSLTNLLRTPLSCSSGECTDDLSFTLRGSVAGGSFDPTLFLGSWTANGSCTQNDSLIQCLGGTKSGSWSVSLTALGTPPSIPEPGSLILLGAGLLGLIAYRRRAR